MCGIAGIVTRGAINAAAIEAMIGQLDHRGPDGDGIWFSDDRHVGFGHRRLAVIDPTPAGAQPMPDPAGNAVITFNGEIYNYLEIADRLRAEGVTLTSKCDTEVLLAAYLAWGEDCLRELNGMFAFAIYDARKNSLFFARDRFGEKPFLFHRSDDFFAFASEYKALLTLDGVSVDIDQTRLLRFLQTSRLGLDDDNQTVFSDIEQLRPGEAASLDINTLRLTVFRYWDVRPDPAFADMSDADAAGQFRDLLTESVRIRLRSDVPIGSCLSGGLDSSAIVCLSRGLIGEEIPYHVFTGRFAGTEADEWPFAEQVIAHTQATSHVADPTGDGFVDDLDEFIWLNELPVGSSSQYAQWCVFRQAKADGITVLLDGQGADELLGGYEQYFGAYLASLPASERTAEMRAISERYPTALDNDSARIKKALPDTLRRTLANWTGRGSDPLFGFTADATAQLSETTPEARPTSFHELAAALYEDSFTAHLPTLLRYGDRNSMAHSREVRLPFCDHRIAEFSLSLSPRLLMGNAETKRLLRASMSAILPDVIRTRWRKQGFLPPQETWFDGRAGALLRDTIESRQFSERGYWQVSWWRNCLKRFEAGERHLAWPLWRPLITEAWHEKFLKRAQSLRRIPVRA